MIVRAVAWVAIIGVVACEAPQNPMDGPEQELPQVVLDALPSDIPTATVVRDHNGCYAYVYAHALIPLDTTDGQPLCLP